LLPLSTKPSMVFSKQAWIKYKQKGTRYVLGHSAGNINGCGYLFKALTGLKLVQGKHAILEFYGGCL
jgi:hypothetical protein